MSGSTFSPPSAEVAEMNRIHYELEYTEGISQRMRIPETLKVAPDSQPGVLHTHAQEPLHCHTTLMQVPERIIIAGDEGDPRFSRPRDLDLIQTTPLLDPLGMKAPPRVLTLTEQSLDSLEPTPPPPQAAAHEVQSRSRSRRERSASDNMAVRHVGHINRGDMSVTPSPSARPARLCPPLSSPEDGRLNLLTAGGFLSYVQLTTRRAYQQLLEVLDDSHRRSQLDLALDMTPDDPGLADASSLQRQIVKLNRRLQLLEEESKERSKREVILYSATVAFWLVNTWVWLRH